MLRCLVRYAAATTVSIILVIAVVHAANEVGLGVQTDGFPFSLNPPTIDTTDIPKAPKPGIHPRIFFQASELPALRSLLLSNDSLAGWKLGQNGNAPVPGAAGFLNLRLLLHGETFKEGYTGPRTPLYNGPYKILYDDLLRDNARTKAGTIDLSVTGLRSKYGKGVFLHASNVAENGFGFVGLYGKLSGSAFVSLISEGEDPFDAKAMGKVLGAACYHHQPIWTPIQDAQGYSFYHDSPDDLGTAYDWLYNDMEEQDRGHCRDLIAAMTGPDRRELGMKWVDFPWTGFNWNWIGWHETIVVLAASIEGEYEGSQYNRFAKDCNLVQSRYFILESSEAGLAREGLGYHTAGMNGALPSTFVAARTHNNLFEVLETRAALHRKQIYRAYTAEPWIDQLEGLNTVTAWDSFSHGDQPSRNRPRSAIVMRKYFPTDPLTAWAFDRSDQIIHYNEPLMSAVFATKSKPIGLHNTLSAVAKTTGLPENLFCRDRGEMIVRDHWGGDATVFDFEVKMNALSLGHNHADRNSFYLYSRGRPWIIDNTAGDVENEAHQTVLIDGLGQGGGATPQGSDTFSAMPGIFLEYAEGSNNGVEFAAGVGNSKPAYDFAASCKKDALAEGFQCLPSPYKRSDFVYPPAPYLNMPKFDGLSETWMNDTKGQYRLSEPIMQFNPVKKAFRSTLFVKSKYNGKSAPWVLVVDDIQKDEKSRKYEFVMNLPWAEAGKQWQYRHSHEQVERDDAATAALNSKTDMILKDVRDPVDSGPRLLVRVLKANGMVENGFKYIARKEIKIRKMMGSTPRLGRQVVIEAASVSPDFCVFLYPHNHGDALPETTWKGSELQVSLSAGDTTRWLFTKLDTGRTQVKPMDFDRVKAKELEATSVPATTTDATRDASTVSENHTSSQAMDTTTILPATSDSESTLAPTTTSSETSTKMTDGNMITATASVQKIPSQETGTTIFLPTSSDSDSTQDPTTSSIFPSTEMTEEVSVTSTMRVEKKSTRAMETTTILPTTSNSIPTGASTTTRISTSSEIKEDILVPSCVPIERGPSEVMRTSTILPAPTDYESPLAPTTRSSAISPESPNDATKEVYESLRAGTKRRMTPTTPTPTPSVPNNTHALPN